MLWWRVQPHVCCLSKVYFSLMKTPEHRTCLRKNFPIAVCWLSTSGAITPTGPLGQQIGSCSLGVVREVGPEVSAWHGGATEVHASLSLVLLASTGHVTSLNWSCWPTRVMSLHFCWSCWPTWVMSLTAISSKGKENLNEAETAVVIQV